MFDLAQLRAAVEAHGPVARVVVAAVKGSAPREPGASMLVWSDGQSGTIGGGTLEHTATLGARARLGSEAAHVTRAALGPAMNQCCGGAVTLVTEVFDAATLPAEAPALARRIEGADPLPGQLRRTIDRCAAQGTPVPLLFSGGWLVEPTFRAATPVVIWGAGHVGQALAAILSPLPEFQVTLADDRPIESPMKVRWKSDEIPTVFSRLPPHAHHLVMTHSHALDLDLCHRLLSVQFGSLGLIGSATKWARFRKRLIALGHSPEKVDKITCPIGDPGLGKHPQAIALGVATAMLRQIHAQPRIQEAV